MNSLTVTKYYDLIRRSDSVTYIMSAVFLLLLSACGVGNDGTETDPVAVDNAVAFIKRPLLFDDNDDLVSDDLRAPQNFRPGAVLYIKDRASPSASSRDISSAAFSGMEFLNDEDQLLYDVKDLDVSYDGNKLVFAMRAPEIEDADEEGQPTWNIWEYDIELAILRRVIASSTTAEEGHDLAPSYLSDGRIIFTSTRQRTSRAILLDEGKGQFAAQEEDLDGDAFVLHTMNSDGSDIQQITFNQSHDLDPVVLANGKVLFSRWDNAGQTRNNGMNLYQVNPDGTGLTYLYGRHSHDSGDDGDTVQFAKPRALDNGEIAVLLREFATERLNGQPTRVELDAFTESDVAIDGSVGSGQSAIVSGISTGGTPSLLGQYGSFFPLYDGSNRYLVSWSVCRIVVVGELSPVEACTEEKLASGDYESASPSFGLWVLDASNGTQLPIEAPEPGWQFDEAVIMTSRSLPVFIPAATLSDEAQNLADDGYGILHVRSVYDFDGLDTTPAGIPAMADPVQTPVANRPARFVRIEKAVSIPNDEVRDFDNTAYGRSRAQLMREILGYAPVEPDGSVRIAVPANVAFAISVLDENGQRTSERHQNWLHVMPGETIECNGCHTGTSEVPHGRVDAEPETVNTGASTTGVEFPNTETVLFADMGETMAETYTRINGIRSLSADIIYEDEWTDAAITPKAASFDYLYSELQTMMPIGGACTTSWSSLCRIVINYETHIHPLWSVDRRILAVDGMTVLDDQTCTVCHSNVDEVGDVRVPDQNLDLTDGPSTDEPGHFKSYRELLFNDNAQEVVDGILIDRLVDSGEVELVQQFEDNGDPVLDIDGNPVFVAVPIMVTVNINPSMRTAGARNSTTFMSRFSSGESHEGYLSTAEMKLVSEWLDLGAQYYNNPFDAPVN